MKIMIFLLLFTHMLYIFQVSGQGNPLTYFDPATKVLPTSNGVVIVETNGTKSTICMNSVNNTNVAIVACRSMNYLTQTISNLSAVAFISSKKTSLAGTYIQNLFCFGNESSLNQCTGFTIRSSVDFKCSNNNQDLSAYCLYNYALNTTTTENDSIYMAWNNLLYVNISGTPVYFCGAKNQYGVNEAKLFCRLLKRNDTYARIIQGINGTGFPIGGFNSLSCPPNAESLQNCTNPYPYQSDECTPNNNIGVACEIQSVVSDNLPEVECGRNYLKLIWRKKDHPDIQPEHVSITYLNAICTNTTKSNNNDSLNMTVNFNDCNPSASGDNTNIIYSFFANRTYPKINNLVVKNDQTFIPVCYIPRNDTVIQGPMSINPASIDGGSNSASVSTTLNLYKDPTFTSPISNLINEPLGTQIFVKVMLINAPNQIVLVVVNCWVSSGSTNVTLISQRCPVYPDTQISPQNDDSLVSFNFKSFNIPGASKLSVACQTSKCGKSEIGCLTTC